MNQMKAASAGVADLRVLYMSSSNVEKKTNPCRSFVRPFFEKCIYHFTFTYLLCCGVVCFYFESWRQ